MSLTFSLRFSDFFPRRLRGHGIKHAPFGVQFRHKNQPRCVQGGCRGGDSCEGRTENIDEWSEERGLPSRRADKARAGARKAHEKDLRARGTYTPPAAPVTEAAYVPRVKCKSCGHKPTGKKNDEGLMFGLCGKCWTRGYSLKHRNDTEQEAAA